MVRRLTEIRPQLGETSNQRYRYFTLVDMDEVSMDAPKFVCCVLFTEYTQDRIVVNVEDLSKVKLMLLDGQNKKGRTYRVFFQIRQDENRIESTGPFAKNYSLICQKKLNSEKVNRT